MYAMARADKIAITFKPSQPTKITAFRTTVKILSQFMPPPDGVPPIVETFKKRAELESQPKC